MGESWTNFPPWAVEERRATGEQGIRPLLLGRDPLDRVGCWQTLTAALLPLGQQWGAIGPIMQAVSGEPQSFYSGTSAKRLDAARE